MKIYEPTLISNIYLEDHSSKVSKEQLYPLTDEIERALIEIDE